MKRYLGNRKLLKIYIDNDDTIDGSPLWQILLKEAKEYGVAGATIYKAAAGMGAHSELHTFNVWTMRQKLPLVLEFIDSESKIRGFLNQIEPHLNEALVTLQDVEVLLYKHPKFA